MKHFHSIHFCDGWIDWQIWQSTDALCISCVILSAPNTQTNIILGSFTWTFCFQQVHKNLTLVHILKSWTEASCCLVSTVTYMSVFMWTTEQNDTHFVDTQHTRKTLIDTARRPCLTAQCAPVNWHFFGTREQFWQETLPNAANDSLERSAGCQQSTDMIIHSPQNKIKVHCWEHIFYVNSWGSK